ncbi:hypothetical protein [Methylocapsa sp. S129]|uniref:hypothetical protein n=1 Tax=Methylocapsa sp. S129 TaxID=1641869 RepID=UPI00131D8738|nr:hypothetical protein [Methylocapsa sp. S129]
MAATAVPMLRAMEKSGCDMADDLIERKTISEIEAEHTTLPEDLYESDRVGIRGQELVKPFGFQNAKWEALKALMQPGDELWTFSSSAGSWRALAGRAGIALVREGQVIKTLVTIMN